jgi:hypothetical protein
MRPVTLKGHKRLRGALNFFELILVDSQRNVYRGELEVRPPGAPTTAGRSGKGVLVRARSKQNRCLEELGVIRRVEEAGMMGEYRFDSYKAHHQQAAQRVLSHRVSTLEPKLNDAKLARADGRLRTIPDVEFGEDVRDVVLDGAFGEIEPIGNLLVRCGIAEQYQNLALAGRKGKH